jgi:hypothetical protein
MSTALLQKIASSALFAMLEKKWEEERKTFSSR